MRKRDCYADLSSPVGFLKQKPMNIDSEIKKMLEAGKTQIQIIKELGTHSQRIQKVKHKSAEKYSNSRIINESFLMKMY